MYFYADKEDRIEKYLVTFDEGLLIELRKEIIDNCSLIEHCEYDAAYGPFSMFGKDSTKDNEYCIKNYSENFLYVRESRDSLQYPDEDIYHFSYDKYIFPKIVFYIDEILKGNFQVLKKAPESFEASKYFKDKIEEVSKELDAIDNLDVDKKQKKLEELKKLVKKAKLNENQKSTNKYLERLNNLISLKSVDTISIEEIARVDSFYEKETKYTRKLCRKRELA